MADPEQLQAAMQAEHLGGIVEGLVHVVRELQDLQRTVNRMVINLEIDLLKRRGYNDEADYLAGHLIESIRRSIAADRKTHGEQQGQGSED